MSFATYIDAYYGEYDTMDAAVEEVSRHLGRRDIENG